MKTRSGLRGFGLWTWWHMWLRGHTISAGPPDPWNVFRCDCGAKHTVIER